MKLRTKLTLLSVFFTVSTLSLCLLLVLRLVTDNLRQADEQNLQKSLQMCSANLRSATNNSPASWQATTLRSVVHYQFSLYARLLQDENTLYSLASQSNTSQNDASQSGGEPAVYLYNLSPYQPMNQIPPEQLSLKEDGEVLLRRSATADAPSLLLGGVGFSVSDQHFYLYISMDTSGTQAQISRLRLIFFLILLVASFSLAILLTLLIRRAFHPIEQLNTQVQAIAAENYRRHPEYVHQSEYRDKDQKNILAHFPKSADEITQLSCSFYQMADSVEETIHALDTQVNKQRLLLAALTHELKTPMTAIIGYSDSLLHMPLSEAQRLQCAQSIQEAGKRTEALSQKMMELIGLTENGQIEARSFPAEELLQIIRKEFPYGLSVECSFPTLYGDPVLLHSLVRNLVENAFKACGVSSTSGSHSVPEVSSKGTFGTDSSYSTEAPRCPGEFVKISIKKSSSSLIAIAVSDRGCGIPPEQIALVTEPFYRVDKARSRKQGGVGLGLALCRLIAERHGGRLEIESEPGRGTTVTAFLVPNLS